MVKQQTSAELADRITFLLHIQKVLGSSVRPETGYPDKDFFIFFFNPSWQKAGQYFRSYHDRFLPQSFQSIIRYSSYTIL
jgi:hypothetical protein